MTCFFDAIKPQSGLITGVWLKNISTFDRNNDFENIFYLISPQKEQNIKELSFFWRTESFFKWRRFKDFKIKFVLILYNLYFLKHPDGKHANL